MSKVLTSISILLLVLVIAAKTSSSTVQESPFRQTQNFQQLLSSLKDGEILYHRTGETEFKTARLFHVASDYLILRRAQEPDIAVPFTSILFVAKSAGVPARIMLK